MGFLSKSEMVAAGIQTDGDNVYVSDKCSIYGTVKIGNNVRIDDFCILSGNIVLGSYIHIGAYCGLYGKMGILMEDFTGLSPRCTLFSASDDFGGEYLISPMSPSEYTNVQGGPIILRRLVQIGAGTIIMPNVHLHEGVAIGAMSFVKKSIDEYGIWAGNPLKFIKPRRGELFVKSHRVLYGL
jgi:galactoside O-acetyltransferase